MFRAVALILLLGTPLAAAEPIVWQIGTPDHNYMEFAIAKNYPAYPERFGKKPLVFEVGKSQPAQDWPFIHPGPTDSWAGSRVHPWKILFSLPDEPRGVYTFRVDFCDVQGAVPPAYEVTIGGRSGQFRLTRGGGDPSLQDPKVGKPQKIEVSLPASLFKKGANEIVLSCLEGSWVQYDALTLLNNPEAKTPEAGIQSVTATATPFYLRRDGRVLRAVDVAVSLIAPPTETTIRLEAAGQTFTETIRELPMFGTVSREIGIPDAEQPQEVKVTATMAGQFKSATTTVAPHRKWQIFVAASSHTDVGYTDLQPKCVALHNQNLDLAAKLIDQYPDFKWNCEVAWQAENFVSMYKEEPLERFLRLAAEGRLGVQALYCNVLTGLCSHEQLCRLTYFAHQLHLRHKVPYSSAMINDVPTWVAAMPTVLAGSGIRYFSGGCNNTRAFTFNQMYDKCPCWWEGPDGSRVMMMFMPGYAHADGLGLFHSLPTARERVLATLRAYEGRKNYPYDAIFANGGVGDNCALTAKLGEVVKAWNDRYEFPKIVLCRNAEFFEHIEKQWGDKLPVCRGSAGTYWEDGAGSSARETALCRNAHEAVAAGAGLLALANRLQTQQPYPNKAVTDAWRNCMLYDEHTWGAHCSISQPETEFTQGQWKIKAQFAVDAHKQSNALLEQGARAMASLVKNEGRALVVLNTMSWPRSDILEVTLPEGTAIVDPATPSCTVGQATLALVKDVPACGYRVLTCGPRSDVPTAQPAAAATTTIESRFYRVAFDPATGAVVSLFDKELNRELVDPKAPYPLNQYLYVAGGANPKSVENVPAGELKISTPQKATLRMLRLGELGQRMIVESSAAMTPSLTCEITVWNDVKRVDISNRLTKTRTYEKEAVYFAFPFAAKKPVFRYEEPCAIVRPDKDFLPGACWDWFTVQHFVEVDAGDAAIAWATPDAPLVCFQDINRGKWQSPLPMTNGHLYAYPMNNYWFTNYLAGQDGAFRFRFSITSRPKADSVGSARFGWAASNPLVSVKADANPDGPLPAGSASLVEIAEPNVLLVGMKKAEAGDALVLRLWEMTGTPTTAHVRVGPVPLKKATACNLVEAPQGPLEVQQSTIAVPIRAAGLATVSIE